jgi:hypothetical protein
MVLHFVASIHALALIVLEPGELNLVFRLGGGRCSG